MPMKTAALEIWVSPRGNDSSSGSKELPFLTLQRAHDALLTLREGDDHRRDVVIDLEDGTYRLTRPLVFDAKDFGSDGPQVEIRAAPGAHPVISGAIQVKGWSLHDKSLNIYKAGVGAKYSRQLYVNGKRADRAATKLSDGNLPAGFLPSPVLPASSGDSPYVIQGGIEFIPTSLNPARWRDPARWGHPQEIEAVIKTQWKMMSVPLQSVTPAADKQKGLIALQQPAWTNANIFFTDKAPGIWSFWQVTRFENAYEFLDQPGEWYLDRAAGELYYIPRPGEDLTTADVELPVLEALVEGRGEPGKPVANLHFEGITFAYATWLTPGGPQGYVADQSGFHLVGDQHRPNIIGHDQYVVRTPGNLRFKYAHNVSFKGNRFEHLGAVGLDFDTGSQGNRILDNTFMDISSAAIQLGGVAAVDHHPQQPADHTIDNTISNNRILQAGREYVDAAGIFIGFTTNTVVSHNTISEVPWSGIAIGWGWGLLDKGMFPGLAGATSGMWGHYDTPTPNSRNRIVHNLIYRFLEDRWDGGAIYSTGQQGLSMEDPLLIEGNVAYGKRVKAGGNTFYTDGGSRYVKLRGNVSYDNPIGHVDLGPPPQKGDPLPYSKSMSKLNLIPYGSDSGGCRTYGDIHYEDNYWLAGLIPLEELALGLLSLIVSTILDPKHPVDPYSKQGFFNICPYTEDGISYPVNLTYSNNHKIRDVSEVPEEILQKAGVQAR